MEFFGGRNRNIASEDGHLAGETSPPPGGVLLELCSDSHSFLVPFTFLCPLRFFLLEFEHQLFVKDFETIRGSMGVLLRTLFK